MGDEQGKFLVINASTGPSGLSFEKTLGMGVVDLKFSGPKQL